MRRITILLIAICCDIALYAQTNTINKAQKTAIEKPQPAVIPAQWKFSGDKHKSLQVDTERTFHQRYPLAML